MWDNKILSFFPKRNESGVGQESFFKPQQKKQWNNKERKTYIIIADISNILFVSFMNYIITLICMIINVKTYVTHNHIKNLYTSKCMQCCNLFNYHK